jgi:cyclophilin family peptidyl-prolyl cis-trans isomerase
MRSGLLVSTFLAVAAATMVVSAAETTEEKPKGSGHPMVVFSTTMGDITVELYPDKAPITVKNFLEYVKAGYYDGTTFHRVIPGFMIQGGGLTADMRDKREGQRPPIKNEASNGLKNDTGTLAMARTSAPDSATSQFFINLKDNGFLNKEESPDKVGYAVFGKVVKGMDVVKKIEGVKTAMKGPHRDVPVEAVTIQSAKIATE